MARRVSAVPAADRDSQKATSEIGRANAKAVVHAPCSDGMSDRTYPDKVEIRVDGQVYRGCGAYAVVFERMRAEENRAR